MPIPFTCPKCGKQMTVADQYAGQTGPCASCGATITIPSFGAPNFSAGAYTPVPQKSGGSSTLLIVLGILAVGGFIGMGCLVALLLPAIQAARSAAQRVQSTNNLKQLGLAMHNYHDVNGCLPPAVVTDENGKPLYSGRVLLLPYMEQQLLFEQWHKDKAWDSPENAPLAAMYLKVFSHPANKSHKPGQTDYLFLTGTGTSFESTGKKMTFASVSDGLSNTILMVEVKGQNVNWAEPNDIDVNSQPVSTDGYSPNGIGVLFADGSVKHIPKNANPTYFKKAASRAGGEMLDPY